MTKMYGLVIKGTRELVHVDYTNGCDEGEITYGPVHSLSMESHLPHWLVGNYDVALAVTKRDPKEYHKAWMDDYEHPCPFYLGACKEFKKPVQLEVVEVTLVIK